MIENTVAGLVFHKNKYLIQERDKKKNIWFPGFYGFFGGMANKNESPSKAINREIKEELNLKIIKKKKLIFFKFKPNKYPVPYNRVYYLLEFEKNFENKISLNEGKTLKFLKYENLKFEKIIPWDLAVIQYHRLLLKKKSFVPNNLFQN